MLMLIEIQKTNQNEIENPLKGFSNAYVFLNLSKVVTLALIYRMGFRCQVI
jgi:hypothetical protein